MPEPEYTCWSGERCRNAREPADETLAVGCETCNVEAGKPCVTLFLRTKADHPHVARLRAAAAREPSPAPAPDADEDEHEQP